VEDRDTILRRFTEWLDQALAGEDPPAGIPDEILHGQPVHDGADLFSMQAAITALTQEVKLEGRSFKQLAETLSPVLQAQSAENRRDAQERAWRQVLDELLDLRERLVRGLETARQAAAGLEQSRGWWLARRAFQRARDTVSALREGYRLTAERLDEILAGLDIRELDCLRRPFDPQSMRALDAEETDRMPEGTVVEVYRRGYEWSGRIYRPADVRVTRLPAGGREEQ
jgi:molecular chaperone GrpE